MKTIKFLQESFKTKEKFQQKMKTYFNFCKYYSKKLAYIYI